MVFYSIIFRTIFKHYIKLLQNYDNDVNGFYTLAPSNIKY